MAQEIVCIDVYNVYGLSENISYGVLYSIQVLLPEEITNPNVDELSVMTYLSGFTDAQLKPGAPIKSSLANADKVKVYGPGIEKEGLTTDVNIARFVVDATEAGPGILTVAIKGPEGKVDVHIEETSKGMYDCSYVPEEAGEFTVVIKYGGKELPKSPYIVTVEGGSDVDAVRAYGPGVESTSLKEGIQTEFWVETTGAGEGALGISIRGPRGNITGDNMHVEELEDGRYHVLYTPGAPGQYIVEVTFSGLHIVDSPFRVKVTADRPDASKCRAEGPGIDGTELSVNNPAWFRVYTKGAGKGECSVHIRGKSGSVPVETKVIEDGVTEFSYLPKENGEYVVTVKFGGDQIPGSRFHVNVEPPTDASKCVASGPGLEPTGVRVNIPTVFQVRTKDAGHGDLQVNIRDPDGNPLPLDTTTAPYTFDYSYVATKPGNYVADIKFGGKDVPGSPFQVSVTDTSKVTITGAGMDGEFLPISEPLEYFVDAREAGPGSVACSVHVPIKPDDYDTSAPKVTDNGDGTFHILYTPEDAGRLKMNVTFAEAAIQGTPIKLHVFDASKVLAYGKGLEDGNKSGELTMFTVDMRQGGEGALRVSMKGPAETPITPKDQANNIVNCEYLPTVAGDYEISVFWAGVHIPGSPFNVKILPAVDPAQVVAYGPGLESTGLITDMWAEFFVDYRKAGKGDLNVAVQGPGGGEKLDVEEEEPGLLKYRYFIDPDEAGEYVTTINFADQAIPKSPFHVNVAWKTDASKVRAYGPGLEGGTTKEWAEFHLDMKKAGEGGLSLNIAGPSEAEVTVDDHQDGTATVKYLPTEPGEYTVNINFADEPISGSPFTPVFEACTDAAKVKAYGPGLESYGPKVGHDAVFTIDTQGAGAGAVDVAIDAPGSRSTTPTIGTPDKSKRTASLRRHSFKSGATRPHIVKKDDDTYEVDYNPRKIGQYKVNVYFADQPIPQSPFIVNVADPSKVEVVGPGVKEEAALQTGDPLCWAVDCAQAGPGEIECALARPTDSNATVEAEKTTDTNWVIKLSPDVPGPYEITVNYAGSPVSQEPIRLNMFDVSKVKVYGPGLEKGRVGETHTFLIDPTEAGNGELSLAMEGPSEATVNCQPNEEGIYEVQYSAEAAGDYKVNVKFSGSPVDGSPFVVPLVDPEKVACTGPGITGTGARVGEPAKVIVDTRSAGNAPVTANLTTPDGETNELVLATTEEPGVFEAEYTPTQIGDHEVAVTFDDEAVMASPFSAPIADPSAVQLSGDGLQCAILDDCNYVDCWTEAAGPGVLSVDFEGEGGAPPVESTIEEIEKGHYQIKYIPHASAEYRMIVKYNSFAVNDGNEITVSNPAACKVYGPGIEPLGVLAHEETYFTVEAADAGPGEVSIEIIAPDKSVLPCDIEREDGAKMHVKYTAPYAGIFVVNVKFAGHHVHSSPFQVSVADPTAVKAEGEGLVKALVDESANFKLDTTEAGEASLNVSIQGPKEAEMQCSEVEDGVYAVNYVPIRAGIYSIHIQFAEREIPGSPFSVPVTRPPPDAEKCVITGLENPGSFVIDATEAGGNGFLEVGVCGAYVPAEFVSIKHNGDYTFSVTYDIPEPGETTISVKWHGQHLKGSPFTVLTEPSA